MNRNHCPTSIGTGVRSPSEYAPSSNGSCRPSRHRASPPKARSCRTECGRDRGLVQTFWPCGRIPSHLHTFISSSCESRVSGGAQPPRAWVGSSEPRVPASDPFLKSKGCVGSGRLGPGDVATRANPSPPWDFRRAGAGSGNRQEADLGVRARKPRIRPSVRLVLPCRIPNQSPSTQRTADETNGTKASFDTSTLVGRRDLSQRRPPATTSPGRGSGPSPTPAWRSARDWRHAPWSLRCG